MITDSPAELRDWALWLQHDAAFLAREAAYYRDQGGAWNDHMATRVQNNAAHSARLARQAVADLEAMP